jgi:hypothetical protein
MPGYEFRRPENNLNKKALTIIALSALFSVFPTFVVK